MIMATALMGIVLSATANPGTPVGSACVSYDPDTPQSIIDCLEAECKVFKDAFKACNGDATCEAVARFNYGLAIAACYPSMAEAAPTTHEWATIWYADGKFGVAFDLWEVPEHATRFEF